DFPYSEFLPEKDVKIAQVDSDASRLGKRISLDVAVHGDVALTLQAVMELITRKKNTRFLHRMLKQHHKALTGVVSAYTTNVRSDFPYSEFLPEKDVKIAQVDSDASRLGKRISLDVAVHGDVALTLQAVMELITRKKNTRFLHRMLKQHHKALTGVVSAYTKNVERMKPIHPERSE